MRYYCCDVRRLEVLKVLGTANAIEFLEVSDHLEPIDALRQRTLFVRLLRPGFTLTRDNVVIEGGERLPTVPVEWAAPADNLPAGTDPALLDDITDLPRTLVVRTEVYGDFSTYTLGLRAKSGSDQPPDGFDPKLSSIEFSFKVECESDFDCAACTPCPPEHAAKPEIDYLAKDYTGFRRLMLDRLHLLVPGWTERSAADVGIALVELMAYAADNLSYRQDAIATEAYLATARKRVSVRRHARLVDYALHEGCNARAWVHIGVDAEHVLPARTPLLTRSRGLKTQVEPGTPEFRDAIAAGAVVFETAHEKTLFPSLNRLSVYTWGDLGCCLPRGATHATLRGKHDKELRAGDVLVFEEMRSPTVVDEKGELSEKDADRTKRWAVRLTRVEAGVDPSGQLFDSPPVDAPLAITEVDWAEDDALPFPLCISVKEHPRHEVSIARGNIVLADHGRTIPGELLGTVPEATLEYVATASCSRHCEAPERDPILPRFRPTLEHGPVSHGFALAQELTTAAPDSDDWFSARRLVWRDPHDALPQIVQLRGERGGVPSEWIVRRDLLGSAGNVNDFVMEVENDGTALLRFGDDVHGKRPNAGTAFKATYRVGNGTTGNVGAESIAHIMSVTPVFSAVSNRMPAAGGIEPEDLEAARRDAPEAFRTQQRAVTAADYAAAAERRAEVQRAAATFRWTGSWHTVFVTADRFGGGHVDTAFETRLRLHLESFRMAGYDLEVDAPRHVPLDITLHICVAPTHFRATALRAVALELGTSVLPDGRLAAFHADRFSFGEPVYLSRIVAAAQAVEGVEAVWVQKFERMGAPDPTAFADGVIRTGRLEIAQLENNPNFRERGRLVLEVGGGK